VPGAEGALLLDSEGEIVIQSGQGGYRHRLIGAYQGITLQIAARTARRHGVGAVQALTCRYSQAALVLRPLKDGYYFVLALGPEVGVSIAERRADATRVLLDKEL
jgi:hypothetical protein